MNIQLNGIPCTCDTGITLAALLARQGVDPRYVAVAVNCEFVPRAQHRAQRLADGDEVELLTPRQGG